MNNKEAKKTHKIKLDYDKAQPFLHCDHCLKLYLADRKKNNGTSKASPRDTFHYEASGYPFEFPDTTVENIMVIWCKTCGRPVWDSRHLTHRY
jgi:hypothetical protein